MMISPHINLNDRICANNRLPVAEIHNELIVMSHEKGLFYGLDDIATVIFKSLTVPARVSELCDKLSLEYDAQPEVVRRDVLNLLEAMAAHELIAVVSA